MDETLVKRVMPHSIEAERSVIGSMLMDVEAIVIASQILEKEDFYKNLRLQSRRKGGKIRQLFLIRCPGRLRR